MKKKDALLIVDDNAGLRTGLRLLFSQTREFSIIIEAANGQQAVSMFESKRSGIDLVLLDVGMPVMDGITACREIKRLAPDTKIIMLTSHDSEDEILAALSAGANGYCLKDFDFERLGLAAAAVSRGDIWLDAAIATKLLSGIGTTTEVLRASKSSEFDDSKSVKLTEREPDLFIHIV